MDTAPLFTITEAQLRNSPQPILVDLCLGLIHTANTLNYTLDQMSTLIDQSIRQIGQTP